MAQVLIPSMDPRNERRTGSPEGLARRVAELDRRMAKVSGGYRPGDVSNVALPFNTNWSNYGSGYENCAYSRYGRWIVLTGLANRSPSGPAGGELIGTLPADFRPSAQLIFNQYTNAGPARIDILTSGGVQFNAGPGGIAWISLAGIAFLL